MAKKQIKKVRRTKRERKKLRLRKHLVGTDLRPRLCVYKSNLFTSIQVISDESGKTLLSASTKDKEVLDKISDVKLDGLGDSRSTKSAAAAKALGAHVASRLGDLEPKNFVFDRNGFIFHGRIKAVADGLKESGVKI